MQLSPIIIASVTAICDNIPSGYVYRSDFNAYYKFNTKIDSWNNHAKSCRDDHHNSYLSSINSYAENQYVVANIASRAAIGARRRDITSDFEWLFNPSYIDFNNWRYNIDKDDHNCAAIYPRNSRRNGQWLNRPCEIADLIGVCKISCEEPEENDYYDYYSLFGPGNDLDLDQEARADFDYTETDCQPLDIEQSLTANDISIPTQMLTFFIDNSCQLRQKYNLSETDFAEKSFNFTRDISRHGCFGKKLDEMRSNPVTHGPIDKLDEIISDWVQCYSCTNKMMCHFDGSFSDESVKLQGGSVNVPEKSTATTTHLLKISSQDLQDFLLERFHVDF